jgi:hypothetical protein
LKSKCLNAKTTPFFPLNFELWNLATEIAAHLSGARNDSKVEGLLAMTNGVSKLAGGFVLGAKASGADVDFSFPSFYHNRGSVNIRKPTSQGTLLGVAYIMSRFSCFTANLTLHRNFSIC